ncbi:MAG: hypothetical protein GXZ13_07000 [Synergistaceae bacterium]|nr:hypothetical protein [Synergistaceae bacterium]
MDEKYSRIDITNDLMVKYHDYLRPEIKTISISQSNEDVWLETLSITIIKDKGWTKETINRINLDFISEDGDIAMFNPGDNIEANASKFINELSSYSLINTTDLFTDEASEVINKKYNIFGIDN